MDTLSNSTTAPELISVVIPTHNRADLLVRAIKSVQSQTYDNIEIIIISDGSTDNTSEVVKELAAGDARIKFINFPKSRGANYVRNEGIKQSLGDYIAFLDDDDEWINDKLACQMKVMKSSLEIGLVYTWIKLIYARENVEYYSKPKESGYLNKRILLDNCIGTTSSVMIKKSLLEEVGGFDISLQALQDYDLWIRCCQKCDVGVVEDIKVNYYNYTQNNDAQISSNTFKYINAINSINKKYKCLFNELNSKELKLKRKNEAILLLTKAMRNKDRKIAYELYKDTVREGFDTKIFAYYLFTKIPFRLVLYIKRMLA